MTEEISNKVDKEKRKRDKDKGYPYISLDEAIGVAKKIGELGGFATKADLQEAIKRKGGWLGMTIVSLKRYGLIEGHGKLNLTEQAKKIISPTFAGEEVEAKKQAFLGVQLFKEIYSRFKGVYPIDNLFVNLLIRNYNIKNKKEAIKTMNIIKENTKVVLGINTEEDISEEKQVGVDIGIMKKPLVSHTGEYPPKKDGKVSIYIHSPMGENNFKANDKVELKALKNKIEKLFVLIEDELQEIKQEEEKDE